MNQLNPTTESLSLSIPRSCGSVLGAGTIFRVATINCGDPEGQEVENKVPQVVEEACINPPRAFPIPEAPHALFNNLRSCLMIVPGRAEMGVIK